MPEIEWGIDWHELNRYNRDLPHWRQEGVLYFVTFRLGDSIPREILDAWVEDRSTWLTAHGIADTAWPQQNDRRYQSIPIEQRNAFERDQARHLFQAQDQCHGSCLLRRPEAAAVVGNALRHYHGTCLLCGDFVVMPNHVHWLVLPQDHHELHDILHSVKRWTAREINALCERSGRLWKKESFDHIVRSPEQLERIRLYIEENPAKARLRQSECLWHRADWL